MKAPDKIYVDDLAVVNDCSTRISTKPLSDFSEYIRKDALLEWLEQNRNQSQMWFDRYNDKEDLSAKQVWEEVIAKINDL